MENILLDSEGNIIRDLVATDKLRAQGNEITEKIINEDNPDELDKLTQLFALNQKKKQIARTNKLSNLIDKVDDEVVSRFNNVPEIIEDRDLLKYWTAASDALSRKSDDDLNIPRVQINNQTNINLGTSGLNRESRARVLEVIRNILDDANTDVIDVEVKEADR